LLIYNGADINAKDNDDETPLHMVSSGLRNYWIFRKSSEQTYKDIAKLLITEGTNINVKNHESNTPLLVAINNRQWDLVKLLIDNGADINVKDQHNNTNGADVNARDKYEKTPLYKAALRGNQDIVDLLLKHGAKE